MPSAHLMEASSPNQPRSPDTYPREPERMMTVFKDIYINEKSLKQLSDLTKVCRKHGVQVMVSKSWCPSHGGHHAVFHASCTFRRGRWREFRSFLCRASRGDSRRL